MLLDKNEEELEEYYNSLNETIPLKFKPSPKMLEMHATLNQLLRNQEYRDAHYLQQKVCVLEKEEEKKHFVARDKKIRNLLQSMRTRHEQEYNTLKKKILLGLQELELNRKREYEKLILKFSNIKKNVENQHTMESYYFQKSVKTAQISKSLKNPYASSSYYARNQVEAEPQEGPEGDMEGEMEGEMEEHAEMEEHGEMEEHAEMEEHDEMEEHGEMEEGHPGQHQHQQDLQQGHLEQGIGNAQRLSPEFQHGGLGQHG